MEAKCINDKIVRKIEASSPVEITWKKGQILIVNNHRVLHARGRSNVADPDRLLKRVLVGA
jgi:alpha-ketoglutarate-dependent taurine dioxygenase